MPSALAFSPARALRAAASAVLLAAALLPARAQAQAAAATDELPQRLSDTGWTSAVAGDAVDDVAAGDTAGRRAARLLAFSPQYPLWSDGADKRRWIALPPDTAIDASDPDAWVFPVGTRLWKEFSHAGRPVETRFIERLADGSWRYATYVWSEDGREAVLAPERGTVLAVDGAPAGRYAVPSRGDCRACHAGAEVPVLGMGALQLSPARDALAAHGRPRRDEEVDLRGLVERGLLRGLPQRLLDEPPRIAARTPAERAALGYLHGNCSHCHHRGDNGAQVPVALTLAQSAADPARSHAEVLGSTVGAPGRYRPAADRPALTGSGTAVPAAPRLIDPSDPPASLLLRRMHSRQPQQQMPPLGTAIPDSEGLALVQRWIREDLAPTSKENRP